MFQIYFSSIFYNIGTVLFPILYLRFRQFVKLAQLLYTWYDRTRASRRDIGMLLLKTLGYSEATFSGIDAK